MRRGSEPAPAGVVEWGGALPTRHPLRDRVDGAAFLTLYAVLTLLLPARLVLAPLGGAGSPATMLGIGAALWWLWDIVDRARRRHGPAQPVRRAVLLFALAVLASYVVGVSRPIAGVEQRSMDSGMINLVAWTGVILVASDGIPSKERLEVLLRRVGLLAGLEGLLGIIQFATGRSFVDLIQIPGLTANASVFNVGDRDGFARPAGTAIHSIEFGVTMAAMLPICLHLALAPGPAGRFRRWFPVAAISVAIPLSISRSALVGSLLALLFLLPTWRPSVRRRAYGAIVGLLFFMFLLVPGFLGTLGKMFTGISNDPSARSRTDSYSLAWEFVSRSPVFGRGFLTFLPEYRILDNQYLGLLIDAGVLGVLSLVAIFATALTCALLVRRRSDDPTVRSLAVALAASVAALASSYAFFDAFAFPQAAASSFMLIGCVGAIWRLQRSGEMESPPEVELHH